jgi:hypothetical protein
MQAIRAATIEGFNEFLQGQRAAPGRADLRLVQFDHEYELVYDARLTEKTYEPRGTTALLDAIGRTINEVGHKLSQIEAKRPARIVFVVVTDGLVNASLESGASKSST